MKDETLFSSVQLGAILGALPDPVFILTRSGRYSAIFGGTDLRYYHDGSSLVGQSLKDVLEDAKAEWFLQEIGTALASRQLHVVEYGLSGRDVKGLPEQGPQDTIWFEGRVQALGFQVQGEDAVLWVASNITERKQLEIQLRVQSETDPLTGLYNRRKLMQSLADLHAHHVRYGTAVSVLVFDMDDFKRINDEHGHLIGDQAISAVADVCRNALRRTDVAARFGGDEFVILMPHTAIEEAQAIVERLGIAVTRRLRDIVSLVGDVTISGGLSQLSATDTSCDDALRRADDALYRAKRQGRCQIVTN